MNCDHDYLGRGGGCSKCGCPPPPRWLQLRTRLLPYLVILTVIVLIGLAEGLTGGPTP